MEVVELKINSKAYEFVSMLEKAGYEAYFVGGFVRDMLMHNEAYDIDITTNASPDEIKKVFSGFTIIETGIKHGTVTVILNEMSAEITTYRCDGSYYDNRHPDKISFCGSLKEDLLRRDFRINAIAFNEKTGIVDLFGGISDIENKIIRCIGKPRERFKEDALRILRALRFSSVLGFKIEKETSEAIHSCKYLLKNISFERIFSELKKILCGKNIKEIILNYIDVFEFILPELIGMNGFDQHNFHHKYNILEHTAVVMENIEPEPVLRLAALFHDCGKPECFSLDENGVGHFYSHASLSASKAKKALLRLKSDNLTLLTVEKLVKIHDSPIEESESSVRKKLNRYGEFLFDSLIKLQRADTLALADEFHNRLKHFDKLEQIKNKIMEENQCFSLRKLDVNGDDLIKEGLSGRQIGKALNFLLESVIEGKVKNEKKLLIEFLKNKKGQLNFEKA